MKINKFNPKKYRPYKDICEIPSNMGGHLKCKSWKFKHKIPFSIDDCLTLHFICDHSMKLALEEAFDQYIWADGSVFGIEVTEGQNVS